MYIVLYWVNKRKGFTLLEIVITLGILAIILAIVLFGYLHIKRSSEVEACRSSCELAEKTWTLSKAQAPEMDDESRMGKLRQELGLLCPSGGVVVRVGNEFICSMHDERARDINKELIEETCYRNREYLFEKYQTYLKERGIDQSEVVFQSFIEGIQHQVCPSGGILTSDGTGIQCSIHKEEEVPFL